MNRPDPPPIRNVAICICTYQRPDGLRAVLHGLQLQTFRKLRPPHIQVIIADNEGSDRARTICEQSRSGSIDAISYRHEPRRGISHARNTCLDAISPHTDCIAMLDDDEIPEPQWLEALMLARQQTGADMVSGPVLPMLPPNAPQWLEDSGLYRRPRHMNTITDLSTSPPLSTCNVLINARLLLRTGVRFDPDFGLSGGEDKLFFQQLKGLGCSSAWAANAIAHETIPPERAAFGYLWDTEYRAGNIRLRLRQRLCKGCSWYKRLAIRGRTILKGLNSVFTGLFGLLRCLVTLCLSRQRLAQHAMLIAFGFGLLASVFGRRYEFYR